MSRLIATLALKYEDDVVAARQRARQVARLLEFDERDQTRIGTAVSEVARQVWQSAKGGEVHFLLEGETAPQVLLVSITERPAAASGKRSGRIKPADQDAAQEPKLTDAIVAAHRLMDQCRVERQDGRQHVRLTRILPRRAPTFSSARVNALKEELLKQPPQSPWEEVRQQNRELMQALEELRLRQEELVRVNRELEDTNRGVVALYAELDEKAEHLRRADEMKSRFLSNTSHEFRTPLNSILGISRLLLDRTDGELTDEQEKQVRYVRQSAQDLLETVNDLLDLAKIEAGKIDVIPSEFEVATLFSALRGMLKPILVSNAVNLVFADAGGLPTLYTDERKVSQILRNFISNALKFTEHGSVEVAASITQDGEAVDFTVTDTGIGITEEDQAIIFEEYTQVDHPLQRRVKGTGLGLPLCRQLASLLGGSVRVSSRVGQGSIFTATIPIRYAAPEQTATPAAAQDVEVAPDRTPLLIVEDEPETRLLYEKYLRGTPFQPIAAGSVRRAREVLRRNRPAAIVLDVVLPNEDAWGWLAELKADERTSDIPVVLATNVEDERKGLALGADAYCVKPLDRMGLLKRLTELTGHRVPGLPRDRPVVLVIDDQEAARYVLRKLLASGGYAMIEAANGPDGLRLAADRQPDLIMLDLAMPGMSGYEVLQRLKRDRRTQAIPVAVVTSQAMSAEQERLLQDAHVVLTKDQLSLGRLMPVMSALGLGHAREARYGT